ncbi:MAG: outer membrane lipoprotein-sorting protein [Gammaproteobacteria bacterium]|nr:outer membrane lipoprotein-sorting protein [Gammaproteobacteria bacterium]
MPLLRNLCLFVIMAHLLGMPVMARSDLPYPEGPLTAEQIARQVHLVIHSGLLRNALSKRSKGEAALIINRATLAKRRSGSRPSVSSFETYINNDPQNQAVDSVRMAIITSGKTKGTGILLTSYVDPKRSSNMLMWLPSLRKIRRILEPDPQDYWFGTTLTYGELVLRKPDDETHELLGEGAFEDCLAVMELEPAEMSRHTKHLPGPQCAHQGKPVYRLKSTSRRNNWWYDYHISEIDKQSFAIYRTVYFKDAKKIKTVSVDWQSLGLDDPRITYPRYIYGVLHESGRDSLVYIPRGTIQHNVDLPDRFWSELTLKKKAR